MEDWALKYRPRRLVDLVGQDVNREILSTLVKQDKLFNAMIFYGRSGCGKTTTARILVNELNAEVVELDAASNNGVDDARNINDLASKLALSGRKKIIIIDEAHMLSKAAWNALLKSIEEPNHLTHFIFCTTEYTAIPNTIRGRSQMFKFYSIPSDTLTEYAKSILDREGYSLDDDCIELIIKESKGQVRDLLKLMQVASEQKLTSAEKLARFLAIPDTRGMGAFLQAVLSGNSKMAVKVLKGLNTDLLEWRNRLEQLIYEILEDKFGISELAYPLAQAQKLRELGRDYAPVEFGKILDYLLKVHKVDNAYQLLYVLATLGVDYAN
nr:MAG TPA: activator clamp loader [Caudoviricetes sp.]